MSVLRLDCPHCHTKGVSFRVEWAAPHRRYAIPFWNCVAVCAHCGHPVCFLVLEPTEGRRVDPAQYGKEITDYYTVSAVWPTEPQVQAPAHTPGPVARRFVEAENVYRQKSWNAAVAMYRSTLDIATKLIPEAPSKGSLYDRLKWLEGNYYITPAMKEWADHVRIEGNASLHEVEEFTENDARPLRLFTEMFLRYAFELPGEVKAFSEAE